MTEVELHRGIWIAGKVTEKATGKPVAEARLHYLPFLDNAFVQDLPEFDRDGNVDGIQTRYLTGADGGYRLVGCPGRAIVGAEGVDGGCPYRTGSGPSRSTGWAKWLTSRLGNPDQSRPVVARRDGGDRSRRGNGVPEARHSSSTPGVPLGSGSSMPTASPCRTPRLAGGNRLSSGEAVR